MPEQEVVQARELVEEEFPETEGLPLVRAVVRDFPEQRKREALTLRHENSEVRYVVLRDETGKTWVQEWETIEQNLPSLDKFVKDEVSLKQKTEVVVEQKVQEKK